MYEAVITPIVTLLNRILNPMILIVGASAVLYCAALGVRLAKAEGTQNRKMARGELSRAIVGFVLIFLLILALKLMMPIIINWVNEKGGNIELK